VLGNIILRRIFGLKAKEIISIFRKLHEDELHDLYSSSGVIRVIRSRKMMSKESSTPWKRI
jgi:hypothetical protein